MNYDTATPREIDTLLARTHYEIEGAERALHMALYSTCRNDGGKSCRFQYVSTYVGAQWGSKGYTAWSFVDLDECEVTRSTWGSITHIDGAQIEGPIVSSRTEDVLALIRTKGTMNERTVAGLLAADHPKVAEALAEVERLHSITMACNDEFVRRGRWSRFYLVTSSQGHIHSSGNCSTCHKGRTPTTFALVCDLSDSTVEEAVDLFGAALCSICFPEAPVEFTDQVKITKARALAYAEGGIDAYRALVAKSTKTTTNA
jgi:hypothetical protein